jgi:hypothetical protein
VKKLLSVSAGILALLSFAGERIVYFYAPGFLTVHQSTWLQYLFFIFFLLQVLTTILLHLEDPEKHLDSLPLGIMIATILVFIISIPLYGVILRVMDFIVRLADPILP